MVKSIDISKLSEEILEHNHLIIGSPLGVGFSTTIAEIIAHYLFFKDDFSILVLTKNDYKRRDMLFKIQKGYNYFGLRLKELNENVLYRENEKGSAVCVLNYLTYNLSNIIGEYDMIVVDEDDCSDILYKELGRLQYHTSIMVINTYDTSNSIFYSDVLPKVILKSEYSKQNIRRNFGKNQLKINYERKLLGYFRND